MRAYDKRREQIQNRREVDGEVVRALDRIGKSRKRARDCLIEDTEIFRRAVGYVAIDSKRAKEKKIRRASEPNARQRAGPPHAKRICVVFSSTF